MMLRIVENNGDVALSMFEVTLDYYNLFTQGEGDKRFIQVCHDKAKQGGPKYAKYVHKFEELTRPPPLRRSKRLRKYKPLILDNVQESG